MKLPIHVVAELALLEATPATMQIEAASVDGARTVEKASLTITP